MNAITIVSRLLFLLPLAFSSLLCAQPLSSEQAREDLARFKSILETQSSYYQLAELHFECLENSYAQRDSVFIPFQAYDLEKILSLTIDRHANIRMTDFEKDDHELMGLYFPILTAPLNGKVAALKRTEDGEAFTFYDPKYPYLKQIGEIPVDQFLA